MPGTAEDSLGTGSGPNVDSLLNFSRPIEADSLQVDGMMGLHAAFAGPRRNLVRIEGIRVRATLSRSVLRLLAENLVHHLGALGERWADLVTVDRLCCGRPVVAGQQCDALHGNAVGGQD